MVQELRPAPGSASGSSSVVGRNLGGLGGGRTSTPLEDEKIAERFELLTIASGGGLLVDVEPATFYELVYSSMSNDEIVEAFLQAHDNNFVANYVKRFSEAGENTQIALWAGLETVPQSRVLLRSNGYVPVEERPDEDHWYNPFDWDDKIRKNWPKAISTPLTVLAAGPRYTLAPTIRATWETLEKSLRFGQRTMRATTMGAIDDWNQRPRDLWGMSTSHAMSAPGVGNITNFPQRWKNAEFENASFTDTARASAQDMLGGDQVAYDILIGTHRNDGDYMAASIQYFTEVAKSENNPDPEGQGILKAVDWFQQGVVNSDEWFNAQDELYKGNIATSAVAARNYDRLVREIPWQIGGFRGAPEDINEMGRFGRWRYKAGMIPTVFTAEFVGAIMFDPVTWGTFGYTAFMRGARAGIRTAQAGNYQNAMDAMYRMTSGVRAADEIKGFGRAAAATSGHPGFSNSPIANFMNSMRVTRGRSPETFRRTLRGARFKETQAYADYVEYFDPNWLGKTPWFIRHELRRNVKEVERIADTFAAYEKWNRIGLHPASVGQKADRGIDPLAEFFRLNPKYRQAAQPMLRWHTDRMNELIPILDDAGRQIGYKRPGLDEWDGVWEFLRAESGHQALMGRAVGGARTRKVMFPNWTRPQRARLATRNAMTKFMALSDDAMSQRLSAATPAVMAESAASYIATREAMLVTRLWGDIQKGTGILDGLSRSVRGLEPSQLAKIFEVTGKEQAGWRNVLKRNVTMGDSQRAIRELGISSSDYTLLREQVEIYHKTIVEDLHTVYKALLAGNEPKGVADEIVDLVKNELPMLDGFFGMHENTFGLLRFTEEGMPILGKGSAFNRRGRQMMENWRHPQNAPPGSVNAEAARRIPSIIEPISDKTWKELFTEVGFDAGRHGVNLGRIGLGSPNAVIGYVETKGIRALLRELNAHTANTKTTMKELKRFIEGDLAIARTERHFYDPVGKMLAKGVELGYSFLYHPVRFADRLTKHVPRNRFIDVANDRTAISEFSALAELGMMADMPRSVIDDYISFFIHGNEAVRWDVQTQFLTDLLGRSGALIYGGEDIAKWFAKFVRQGDHAYSNLGADLLTGSMGSRRRAVIPGVAHGGQLSKLNIIPDYRELGKALSYMSLMRRVGYARFGPATLDKYFAKFWRPAVLLRTGIALRNGVDEIITFALREGPWTYTNTHIARVAQNKTKIWDAYGMASLEPVSDATRRLSIMRPGLRGYRAALDFLSLGDVALTRAAEKAAITRHGAGWVLLHPEEQRAAIIAARETAVRGFIIGDAARGLLHLGEATSNFAAKQVHWLARRPGGGFYTRADIANWIMMKESRMGMRGDKYVRAKTKAMSNPVILDAVSEQINGPYSYYTGRNVGEIVDDVLQLEARGISSNQAIPYTEMNYSNAASEIAFVGEGMNTSGSVTSQAQAAAQHIRMFREEPAIRLAARELSHLITPQVEDYFRGAVASTDGGTALMRNGMRRLGIEMNNETGMATRAGLEAWASGGGSVETIGAAVAHELISDIGPTFRGALRDFWDGMARIEPGGRFPHTIAGGTYQDEIIEGLIQMGRNDHEQNFLRHLLEVDTYDTGIRNDALAWLLNREIEPLRLVGGSGDANAASAVIRTRQNEAIYNELIGIEGWQRMQSLIRTNGADPIAAKVMNPVGPDQMALWFPQVRGDTAVLLGYMYSNPNAPLAIEMRNKLGEILTSKLGSRDSAIEVLRLADPTASPFAGENPVVWLGLYLENAGDLVTKATRLQGGSTTQFVTRIDDLLRQPEMTDVIGTHVPLLAGSVDATEVERILSGFREWRVWLRDGNILPAESTAAFVDDAGKTVRGGSLSEGMAVRRIFSIDEFYAKPGFGRYYGTTSGHKFTRQSGVGPGESEAVTVLYVGDQGWANSTGVPSGWVEEMADGVPTGNWMPSSSSSEISRAVQGREWVEEEIVHLADSLLTLPQGSRVRFPAPNVASGDAGYDHFGRVMNKLVDTINDGAGGTVADLERAIWEIVGDLPPGQALADTGTAAAWADGPKLFHGSRNNRLPQRFQSSHTGEGIEGIYATQHADWASFYGIKTETTPGYVHNIVWTGDKPPRILNLDTDLVTPALREAVIKAGPPRADTGQVVWNGLGVTEAETAANWRRFIEGRPDGLTVKDFMDEPNLRASVRRALKDEYDVIMERSRGFDTASGLSEYEYIFFDTANLRIHRTLTPEGRDPALVAAHEWARPAFDEPVTIPRDFIGTVGGEKGNNGLRRIFPEVDETATVPDLELIPEPFGDVTEAFPNAISYRAADVSPVEAARLRADEWVPYDPLDLGESMGKGGKIRTRQRGRRRNPRETLKKRPEDMPNTAPVESVSPVALQRYRQAQIDEMIDSGHVDTVWPFFRDKPVEGMEPGIIATNRSATPSHVVERIAHVDVATLRANPEKFYLFGDNLQGTGRGGQAIIRGEPNAVGVPTKKAPTMRDDAFFRDTELAANQRAIDRALDEIPNGATVVIPEAGLGTGRARMAQTAPETFEYLQMRLDLLEGIQPKKPFFKTIRRPDPSSPMGYRLDKVHFAGPLKTETIPLWLQDTRHSAARGKVPVDWQTRGGSPTPVTQLVRKRVTRGYPEHQADRTMWVWDHSLNRGVSSADLGGLSNQKYIGVNPYSLTPDRLENIVPADGVQKLKLWQNTRGEHRWLREGQEATIPYFNPSQMGSRVPKSGTTIVHGGRGQNMILSNWAEEPFQFRGDTYRTAEGAYHAHKSGELKIGFENLDGYGAWKQARDQRIPTNRDITEDLMREILQAKFDQIEGFRRALLSAKETIIHPVGDRFWQRKFPELLDELRTKQSQLVEWTLIDEQWLGPVDSLNMAEHMSRTLSEELNHLVTTLKRPNADGAAVHHALNLELADPITDGAGMLERVVNYGNPNLYPERMVARVPITGGKTVEDRILNLYRGFFDGAVNPMIRALAREPMFDYYFMEALEMTRGVRNYYQHEANSFDALRRIGGKTKQPQTIYPEIPASASPQEAIRIQQSVVVQKKIRVEQIVEENGVTQTRLPDFDDFIEFVYPGHTVTPDDAASKVAAVLHEYVEKHAPRTDLRQKLFRMREPDQLVGGRPSATGIFFEAFPEYRETFIDMYIANKTRMNAAVKAGRTPKDEYEIFTRQLIEYLNLQRMTDEAHVNVAAERALYITSQFVDDHSLRSEFQEMVGTFIPFWFAEEQFLRRWARTLQQRPDALRNLAASLNAAHRSGLIIEDKNGEKRVTIPGSEFIPHLFNVLAEFPVARRVFGTQGFGHIGGALTMPIDTLLPGYNEDTGQFQFGPLASLPLLALSTFDPSLRGDGVWGFEDNLISRYGYDSKASELVWQTVVPPFMAKILAGAFGIEIPGWTGARVQAMGAAIEAFAAQGMLPSEADLAQSPNPELFMQEVLQAMNHVAMQYQLMQNLTWYAGLATATPSGFVDSDAWEWNEIFQSARDSGIPYEQAMEIMLDTHRRDWERTLPEDMPDWERQQLWMTELRTISVFQQGKTGKYSVAALPQTFAAGEWMADNQEILSEFPLVATFFIPRGTEEDEKEWSSEARGLSLALDLRYEKMPEEYIISIYVSAASIPYYAYLDQSNKLKAEARAAGDSDRVKYLDKIEEIWKAEFLEIHPVFEQEMFGAGSRARRQNTVEQMRLLLNAPQLIPEDTPFRGDILRAMEIIVNFDNDFRHLQGQQTQAASDQRNRVRAWYSDRFEREIANKPWLHELYYNVFRPLIQEGWFIKREAGLYPETAPVLEAVG